MHVKLLKGPCVVRIVIIEHIPNHHVAAAIVVIYGQCQVMHRIQITIWNSVLNAAEVVENLIFHIMVT